MTIDELRKGRILITGSSGFLGRWLIKTLVEDYGCGNLYAQKHTAPETRIISSAQTQYYNLTSSMDLVDLFKKEGPFDYIFNVAGYNGGIGMNSAEPATIFYLNTVMGLNLLFGAAVTKAKKVVSVVASCAYPALDAGANEGSLAFDFDLMDGVLYEEAFLGDFTAPHSTVACHGYAKRNLQLASKFFHDQYGLNAVCVCPTTLYGIGDSFEPERTKVLGAMIARFVKAQQEKAESVTCWGSGSPLREFLYVEDAARLLVESMLKYEDNDVPLNLGSGFEVSIKELAELVAAAVGYEGRIEWDTSKPDGQRRKRLDLTRMKETLDVYSVSDSERDAAAYFASGVNLTSLYSGVHKTVDWYKKNVL